MLLPLRMLVIFLPFTPFCCVHSMVVLLASINSSHCSLFGISHLLPKAAAAASSESRSSIMPSVALYFVVFPLLMNG